VRVIGGSPRRRVLSIMRCFQLPVGSAGAIRSERGRARQARNLATSARSNPARPRRPCRATCNSERTIQRKISKASPAVTPKATPAAAIRPAPKPTDRLCKAAVGPIGRMPISDTTTVSPTNPPSPEESCQPSHGAWVEAKTVPSTKASGAIIERRARRRSPRWNTKRTAQTPKNTTSPQLAAPKARIIGSATMAPRRPSQFDGNAPVELKWLGSLMS
jgi:hypothetical protein